jgi:AcrR family transcriptional regulator
MVAPSDTAERILTAFLKLAAERGIEGTTTRALAKEAGVNEVTIFRYFKDKTTLIREAYHHFAPGSRIVAYPLSIDASSPAQAAAGMVECLKFLRDCLREHPQLLLAGMSEYWHFPELQDELAFHSHAAHHLIEQALAQAASMLRPEVDRETTAMSLLGLLLVTLFWQYRGWLTMTDEEWDHKLEASIHPLLLT